MLKQWRASRGESWDESGPSISEHCSLATEPSVHIRQVGRTLTNIELLIVLIDLLIYAIDWVHLGVLG